MDKSKIQEILDQWQARIRAYLYTPLFDHPFCCLCFKRLTVRNVTVEGETLVDVCKKCKKHEDKEILKRQNKRGTCAAE